MRISRPLSFAVLAGVLAMVGIQLLTGWFYAGRPQAWGFVSDGMSREQVYSVLGNPTAPTIELKGQDSWRRVALLNERTLVVRYDTEFRVATGIGERVYWRWSNN